MKFIRSIIEQLHLAAEQLHIEGASYARFSLLLTDNIVELIAHNAAGEEVARDVKRKYSQRQKRKALGQDFVEKVNFLCGAELLEDSLGDFYRAAHLLRNECYHRGVKHENILWHVAWAYHEAACDSVVVLKRSWLDMDDETSVVLEKHLKEAGIRGADLVRTEGLIAVMDSLKRVKPRNVTPLSNPLSAAALELVDDVESDVKFLLSEGAGNQKPDEVIRSIMFYASLDVDGMMKELRPDDTKGWLEYNHHIAQLDRNFTTEYTQRYLKNWRVQATALANEKDFRKALVKYTRAHLIIRSS